MAQPPVVKFLDFGQYKYELTKREKEAKRKQRSVTFKEVRLSPKIGVGRLPDEGQSRDRVPRRRRSNQGDRPLPRPRADPPGDRAEPHRQVRGTGQGPRGRGTDAVARRQVDAHHDGIDPQAQESRRPGPKARGRRGPGGRPGHPGRGSSGRRGGGSTRAAPAPAAAATIPVQASASAARQHRSRSGSGPRRGSGPGQNRDTSPGQGTRRRRQTNGGPAARRPPPRHRDAATRSETEAGSRAGPIRRVSRPCPR